MQVTHITPNRREKWNAFVAQEPYFALLQSWEWGEFKEKLGWKAFRVAVESQGEMVAGAQLLIKYVPLGLASIAYIPRGPVGDWLNEEIMSLLFSELHQIARQNRAIFLKIEPSVLNDPATDRLLRQYEFQPSPYTNQPQATILIDLTAEPDDILRQMRKKTRQYINQAERKGVTVRVGTQEDLPALYELMQITGQRNQFAPRTFEYYEKEWQTFIANDRTIFLMAFYEEQLLAVRTAYHFGQHAAEFHAGSSDAQADLRANYLLVWEAIKWAKARGCQTYDLWGIPNEIGQAISQGEEPTISNRTDGLWGVYRFKSGFSKEIVCYAGAYDYVYSPLIYNLFTNRFVNAETLDRLASRMDVLKPA